MKFDLKPCPLFLIIHLVLARILYFSNVVLFFLQTVVYLFKILAKEISYSPPVFSNPPRNFTTFFTNSNKFYKPCFFHHKQSDCFKKFVKIPDSLFLKMSRSKIFKAFYRVLIIHNNFFPFFQVRQD